MTGVTKGVSKKRDRSAAARVARLAAEKLSAPAAVKPKSNPRTSDKTRLSTATRVVPVESTMRVQTVSFALTEKEIAALIRDHVITVLIPEHYARSRKAVPPHLTPENLHATQLVIPTESGSEYYDEEGEYLITLDFRLPHETP